MKVTEHMTDWTLSGTGIVRYVHLDPKSRRQSAWGIEFESLDEGSHKQILRTLALSDAVSYIPRLVS